MSRCTSCFDFLSVGFRKAPPTKAKPVPMNRRPKVLTVPSTRDTASVSMAPIVPQAKKKAIAAARADVLLIARRIRRRFRLVALSGVIS